MGSCYKDSFEVEKRVMNRQFVYVSFSGGKDSTAMLIHLLELGEKIDKIVFADTGFEYPELYEYIDRIEKYIQDRFDKNLKITRLPSKKEYYWKYFNASSIRGKNKGKVRGAPLVAFGCWFSRDAKVIPLQKAMIDADKIYVGIAYDELHRVKDDTFIRYPLVDWKWTEQDCVDFLNKLELMNPLYQNYNRLGCYFCPKQSHLSWYVLYHTNKDLWNKSVEMDELSFNLSGHGLQKTITLKDLGKRFESGFVPKQLNKYKCESCSAVASAFKMRQLKLDEYVKSKR